MKKETKKFPIKKALLWTSLFVVVFIGTIFLKAFMSMNTTAQATAGEVKEEEVVEPEKITSIIGKPLTINGTTITVGSTARKPEVKTEVSTAKPKGEFLVLDVIIKNSGKRPITIDSNMFALKLGDIVFSSDTGATVYANNNEPFFMQLLNPGLEMKGKIVFDVPKGLQGLKLNVSSAMYENSYAEISLQ